MFYAPFQGVDVQQHNCLYTITSQWNVWSWWLEKANQFNKWARAKQWHLLIYSSGTSLEHGTYIYQTGCSMHRDMKYLGSEIPLSVKWNAKFACNITFNYDNYILFLWALHGNVIIMYLTVCRASIAWVQLWCSVNECALKCGMDVNKISSPPMHLCN